MMYPRRMDFWTDNIIIDNIIPRWMSDTSLRLYLGLKSNKKKENNAKNK